MLGATCRLKLGVLKSKVMKRVLIGLCALSLLTGLAFAPKVAAQSITITVGPATDDSYWVWNDEYQCWIWNGPEFQGDYQGHPYSYWHGRHQGGGDRNNRPVKGNVGQSNVEQSKVEQPTTEVEKPKAKQPKVEEKRKVEEKSKTKSPKTEDKKDHQIS